MGQTQRFLSVHGPIQNLSRQYSVEKELLRAAMKSSDAQRIAEIACGHASELVQAARPYDC